jgi:hypothetical protein
MCFLCGPTRCYIWAKDIAILRRHPCGGGVKYLHRDPASRKRRRNGKSQIWDSKIWSRVPRDSDPRKIALGRPSSIYKRQTRPFVREGAPQKQDRNCQIVIAKYLVMSPRWGSTPRLTDWPSVAMWLWVGYWGEVCVASSIIVGTVLLVFNSSNRSSSVYSAQLQ